MVLLMICFLLLFVVPVMTLMYVVVKHLYHHICSVTVLIPFLLLNVLFIAQTSPLVICYILKDDVLMCFLGKKQRIGSSL